MTLPTRERRNSDRAQMAGNLTMGTVVELYEAGMLPHEKDELVVDLSKVEAVDSAAVALLLSWLRHAQRSGVKLRFMNVPDSLLSLARLYGVAEWLPITSRASTAQP